MEDEFGPSTDPPVSQLSMTLEFTNQFLQNTPHFRSHHDVVKTNGSGSLRKRSGKQGGGSILDDRPVRIDDALGTIGGEGTLQPLCGSCVSLSLFIGRNGDRLLSAASRSLCARALNNFESCSMEGMSAIFKCTASTRPDHIPKCQLPPQRLYLQHLPRVVDDLDCDPGGRFAFTEGFRKRAARWSSAGPADRIH